jgi:glycerophosphoryl diester phosphodiesterase
MPSARPNASRLLVASALLSACLVSPPMKTAPLSDPQRPLIIAHRGASGERPEHTLEAYDLAITQGADFIEPDVVSTKDGVLVARHDTEIGLTTDVSARYPERRRSAVVDGDTLVGWFIEDFTIAELRELRARERVPTRSTAFDGRFGIPTLDDVLALVRRREHETGRPIGVYPETKHPTYFRRLGLPLEERLLETLARHGFRDASDAVFIQSFETGNLRALRAQTTIRLVQLIDERDAPFDLIAAGDTRTYRDMITPHGLREIATYANAIGPAKGLVQPLREGALVEPTSLVSDAHTAGLEVHVWTVRSDPPFLPAAYAGDARAEWLRFAQLGVDAIFGDFPSDGVRALRPR